MVMQRSGRRLNLSLFDLEINFGKKPLKTYFAYDIIIKQVSLLAEK